MSAVPWWTAALALAAWSAGLMTAVLLQPRAAMLVVAAATVVAAAPLWRGVFAVMLLLGGAAFLLGTARGALASPPILPATLAGAQVTVSGTIDDDPVSRRNGTRVIVAVDRLMVADGPRPAPHRLQATLFGPRPLHYGDRVLLAGRLEEAGRFEQFDYRTFLADQGISGVLQSPRLLRLVPHGGDPAHRLIFQVRHALVAAVDRILPEPQAALLLGVVFGYRAALPPVLEQQMIASGLIHIVVISGLKVSLLARLIHQGLGRFLPRAAPLVALGAMVVYALIAGASAAALRAAAMGGLVVLAGTLKRDTHVYTSMALTAAVMLGLKPDLAHDVSFQLSFAGTLGIATFTDPIARRLPFLPGVLRDPFAATIAAEAATWPLMLADFHQVSFVAPLANALVLPLLPVMMVVGGGGAIVATAWSVLGWPALQAAGAIASWFRLVIETTASLPGANLTAPYFPGRWLAAAALLNAGALTGIRLRRFFWQRKVWAVLGGAALIVIALLLVRPDGRVHVYALDVGTGSGVLLRTGNGHQILIDGGPDPDRFAQAVGRGLPPTARTLKVWVITGGRRTEIGAGTAVLDRFRVERIVVADPDPWTPTLRSLIEIARRRGIRVEPLTGNLHVDGVDLIQSSDQRTWLVDAGQARLAIIPPDGDWRGFPVPMTTAIFTRGGPEEWPASDGAGIAAIQVAANSRDGLPAHTFLQVLQGTHIMRTDRLGTVELVSGNSGWSPAR